jgi:hypothetical protein
MLRHRWAALGARLHAGADRWKPVAACSAPRRTSARQLTGVVLDERNTMWSDLTLGTGRGSGTY